VLEAPEIRHAVRPAPTGRAGCNPGIVIGRRA
jgi:hypothetical protein